MTRKKRIMTIHHVYPKWLWWSNHPNNLKRLSEIKHQALHILTDKNWKAQAPIEQLSTLFEIISSPIIRDIKEEIKNILELAEEIWTEAYKKECLL